MPAGAMMAGYHTRWARPQDVAGAPERIAIREALAFGEALHDIRPVLGLSVAELALRAAVTDDDIERIEEGGTEPTIPLQRRLDADVRLAAGHDLGLVWFKPRPPWTMSQQQTPTDSAAECQNR